MPDGRARVEGWLQYFSDLGFSSTYRDRASANATLRTEPAAMPPLHEDTPAQFSAARRQTLTDSTPPAKPAAVSANSASLPVVQSPSLFDAADRIENDTLEKIRETIGDCTRCRLHEHRTKIVFGVGNSKAELVFVGEGPGRDEDIQGEPFVGRAGKLLTQMIEAMGLRRADVYICNVVKCRPPENRTPEKDEMATCSPFLYRQLDVIRPKAIVCLGAVAVQALLGAGVGITKARGQWFDFRGTKLMPTYHPAYLLRNPAAKGDVWKDLQQVMAFLGLELPRAPRAQPSRP
jgi:uracil-DNA glycosylase